MDRANSSLDYRCERSNMSLINHAAWMGSQEEKLEIVPKLFPLLQQLSRQRV